MTANLNEMIGKPKVGKWVTAGSLVILVFILTLGSWAGLVPIDSATLTKGTVVVKGKHKEIQHFEGGIVEKIYVKENSNVRKGQLLIGLKRTRAQAALDLVNHQYISAVATGARLLAEKQQQPIIWPPSLDKHDQSVQAVLQEQETIYKKRTAELAGKIHLIENKIKKSQSALYGLNRQRTSAKKQYKLIASEVENTRAMVKRGLATKQKLIDLERQYLDLDERLLSLDTRVSAARYEIDDGELQISNIENSYNNEIAELLQQTRLNISDLKQKRKAAKDVSQRVNIKAPINGVVINLAVTTNGSVIASGETIMEIVPSDASFQVETRIKPTDIDIVKVGALTRINFTAYKQRLAPTLEGTVSNISADILHDKNTNEAFYNATIEINDTSLEKYPAIELYPGMPANIMIISDSRTVIEYLFQPVFDSFRHAFREQ